MQLAFDGYAAPFEDSALSGGVVASDGANVREQNRANISVLPYVRRSLLAGVAPSGSTTIQCLEEGIEAASRSSL